MNQENVQFEFKGFDPDSEMRVFISNVLEKIYMTSPSDAAIKMVIQKGKGAIKASCRIVSQGGTFVAETISDSPVHAVQKIERKLRRKLDNWKEWRFHPLNLKHAI